MKHNWDTAVPYVYFAECVGHDLIKIGCTGTGVHLRIKALRQASPFDLVCIGMIAADVNTETELHRQFRHIQHKNEWFYATAELRAYIEEVCPNFDYAKSEYEAFRFDWLRRLQGAFRYNRDARDAYKGICCELGLRPWDDNGWINGSAYPKPELITAAELFFERGCDRVERKKRVYIKSNAGRARKREGAGA